MKKCLQPIEVAQVIQLLKDDVFIYSKKVCCGRREDVICRKQDMALEGHQPKHRTCVCFLVQEGCRHVTLKVTKVVISLLTGIFLIKLWETVFMSMSKTWDHSPARSRLAGIPRRHLNRQVHHWFLFVLTAKNNFYLETIGRRALAGSFFLILCWDFSWAKQKQSITLDTNVICFVHSWIIATIIYVVAWSLNTLLTKINCLLGEGGCAPFILLS